MRLPIKDHSRVALIGTATYTHVSRESLSGPTLLNLPGIHNNLVQLAAVLTDPETGGFTAEHSTVLLDPLGNRAVYEALQTAAAGATDTLLIYYAGHGLLDPIGHLHLSLPDTDPGMADLSMSAFPIAWVKRLLADAKATHRILILDCCYSGRAAEAFMGGSLSDLALVQTDPGSVLIIASAPPNLPALAPPENPYTAFTGELIRLLRVGTEGGDQHLVTMDKVYQQLDRYAASHSLPRPRRLGTGFTDDIALTISRRMQGSHSHIAPVRSASLGSQQNQAAGTHPDFDPEPGPDEMPVLTSAILRRRQMVLARARFLGKLKADFHVAGVKERGYQRSQVDAFLAALYQSALEDMVQLQEFVAAAPRNFPKSTGLGYWAVSVEAYMKHLDRAVKEYVADIAAPLIPSEPALGDDAEMRQVMEIARSRFLAKLTPDFRPADKNGAAYERVSVDIFITTIHELAVEDMTKLLAFVATTPRCFPRNQGRGYQRTSIEFFLIDLDSAVKEYIEEISEI